MVFFQDLSPNTQYNLKVELPGLHKLSGVTTASVSTKSQTEILRFEAGPGSQDGSVRLELELKDGTPEPAFWTLQYGKTGEEPSTLQFTGRSYEISGLENGAAYSFRLLDSENLCLSSQTQADYTVLKPVEAENLRLDSMEDGEALLRWTCTTDLPEQWTLLCTDAEGRELPVELHEPVQTEEGWDCSAAIPGILPQTDYQISLSAPGLYTPLTLELKDDLITLEDFSAEATAQGLSLRWTASREPAAGWRIVASFGEDLKIEDLVHGDNCVLAVLPDTDYIVTLEAADGSSIQGENSLSVRSSYTQRFTQMGLSQGITIGTYFTPDKADWSFADLGGGTVSYRHDDKITFVITAGGWPIDSDETVTVQYVVWKPDSGQVVNVQQEKLVWNTMWQNGQWFGQIPWLPETPGAYSFTIYINSLRLGTIGFTLIQ